MRIRADLNVNGSSRKLVLVATENEKWEHLALKLAAYLSFWDRDLTIDPSPKHPAFGGFEFRPDLLGMDQTGSVSLWVECGNTSLNKVFKALRRFPEARLTLFREDPHKARRMREEVSVDSQDKGRVEILGWPLGVFVRWCALLGEKTEVFGEADGVQMNLVVNEQVFSTDFLRF